MDGLLLFPDNAGLGWFCARLRGLASARWLQGWEPVAESWVPALSVTEQPWKAAVITFLFFWCLRKLSSHLVFSFLSNWKRRRDRQSRSARECLSVWHGAQRGGPGAAGAGGLLSALCQLGGEWAYCPKWGQQAQTGLSHSVLLFKTLLAHMTLLEVFCFLWWFLVKQLEISRWGEWWERMV